MFMYKGAFRMMFYNDCNETIERVLLDCGLEAALEGNYREHRKRL